MKVSKEFKEFFNEFHEKFPSGNFLHIATSDGNWETKHIVWCLMHWLDYADGDEKMWLKEHEREIINMCSEMLDMTERQRFKIWDAVEDKGSDPINNTRKNIAKAKAIQRQNIQRLKKLNPGIDNKSGIYFLTRNEPQIYIGQARHLDERLASHLSGYEQHIDRSLKAHGLYSEDNPYGYKVNFLHYPESKLDEMEQYYIQLYAEKGWSLKNKTAGSQGVGKVKIADFKPAKGYHDGIKSGRRSLARELSHIIDTHLTVGLKPEKQNNKVSQRALEKFKGLLEEGK